MAKKKANPPQSENNTKLPKNQHETPTDDAVSEKLHSLKSLNSMLLKETVERRQQVDSLTQINKSLESELNRFVSDNASLQSEFNRLSERLIEMEIDKGVASRVFSEKLAELEEVNRSERVAMSEKIGGLESRLNQIVKEKSALEGEIGVEKSVLSRVSEERDAIRAQMEDRIRIENELRLKLAEVEKKEAVGLEELRKVRADYDGLVKEKASVEQKMDLVFRETESIGRNLVESTGIINDLKRDINKITEEKMVIEEDRDLQEKKKNELQMSVDGLNELVNKLLQGKAKLLEEISKLEKKCVMNTEKEAGMSTKIDLLVKEKHQVEARIQRLTQEKSLVTKDLEEALKKLSNQNRVIDQLVEEKTKINDAKNEGATQIIKFKEELEGLKNTVKNLEKSSVHQTNNIKRLESENSLYRAGLDQATVERDHARVSLEGEKVKVKELTMSISMVEKKLEDMQKKLSKMQKESEKLVAEKKGLENTCAELEIEILAVKKILAKTRDEHDDTKAKLALSEANTTRILKTLENMGIDQETEFGEEIKDHVTEIEAIKKSFKDKESVIEEMKKQLEVLKVSVVRADKGKSFWTMVSSATAILAAVSFACVARGGN